MIKFTVKDGNIPNEVQSNSLLSLSVYMRIKAFVGFTVWKCWRGWRKRKHYLAYTHGGPFAKHTSSLLPAVQNTAGSVPAFVNLALLQCYPLSGVHTASV